MNGEELGNFKIKLNTYIHDDKELKGIFLTQNEYALLTNKPYQTIVEECNNYNNRKLFRKAIYLKEKKRIFVYGEKPLYRTIDAKVFRLELKLNKSKVDVDSYPIITHPTYKIQGYWINKKEYAQLTNQSISIVTTRTQNNNIEFGQIYKKDKEYQFFIPTVEEDFDDKEIEIFYIKLAIKNITEAFQEIMTAEFKERTNKLSMLLKYNPQLVNFLSEFSDIEASEVKNLKEIAKNIDKNELSKIKHMSTSFEKIFKR